MSQAPFAKASPERAAAKSSVDSLKGMAVTSDFGAIEPQWRGFESNAVGYVFQTFDFIAAWHAHVGKARGIVPRIVTGHASDGRLVCVLPFGICRISGIRVVVWLGGEHADYHGGLYARSFLETLAADPAQTKVFVDKVLASLGNFDLVHLTQQPETLDGFTNPFLYLPSYRNANKAHATVLAGDWEHYYSEKASKSWRRTDRKHGRRLAELGEVRFEMADEADSAWRMLDILAAQKRETLAKRGVPDSFAPDGVRDFYRDLAARGLASGMVEVSALTCGGDVAAVNYGLIHGDRYYYVLTGYDLDRFAGFSPGRQHLSWLLQRSFEHGIRVFDFTIGDESYKEQRCEVTLELWDSVASKGPVGAAVARSYRLLGAIKRKIKGNPAYWARVVQVRKALLRLRGQPRD